MVKPESFRRSIKRLLSPEYEVEFLGNKFEQTVRLLTERAAERIFSWIEKAIKKDFRPITIKSQKQYKNWFMHQLPVFR